MHNAALRCMEDLVFMKQLHLFDQPDVILYHPGHFPELNEQLLSFYEEKGAELILIPGVYNSFLKQNEYNYYAPLLSKAGISEDRLMDIPNRNEAKGVESVIHSAFEFLNSTPYRNVLLAGKSFFCRRFYLLSSLYASDDKVLDVLPLQDNREIVPEKWTLSEKGRARVLNEVEQLAYISNEKLSKQLEEMSK